MKCKRCQQLVFDYLDETVSKRQETAIDRHLRVCTLCSAFYAEEKGFASFAAVGMKNITSSLSIDEMHVERLKALAKGNAASGIPFLSGIRRLVLKPAAVILVLCIIPVVIWLISSQRPGPEERETTKMAAYRDRGIIASSDLLITDSLRDWHERRLVITVRNEKGRITKRIITSMSNEEIVLHTKNNGG